MVDFGLIIQEWIILLYYKKKKKKIFEIIIIFFYECISVKVFAANFKALKMKVNIIKKNSDGYCN